MPRLLLLFAALFSAVNIFASKVNLKNTTLYNPTAYISSQCYTKTIHEENKNILSNPCFSCHTKNKVPNFTFDDDSLQEAYNFPATARENPWVNLFKDRTELVSKISDKQILNYVREDNYKDKNGNIILAKKLNYIPKNWDVNDNNKWDGYIPDCNFNFDNEGFDRDKKGNITGWRAFAYYPFLGTFWPTNGSTDDVLIRLPKIFWQNSSGEFDLNTYKLNLSIVESLLKQKDITIEKIDEKKYGIDLNQDGKLDLSNKIIFKWKIPKYDLKTGKLSDFSMSYVGLAKEALEKNELHIAPGLYPKGTEFLHSVRYIDVDKNSNIKMASRMKELRYAKKLYWASYGELKQIGENEIKEKSDFPDRIEKFTGNVEIGLSNKRGWYYQGFIEDKKGDLRPQSYEETLFCIGCHSDIGAIADSTFVFQRKFENTFKHGWYHWSKKGLKNIPDKKLSNGDTEYVRYLKLNHAGDEFRENLEVINKFFEKNLKLKPNEIAKIKKDISHLMLPSKRRALELNKAYKIIVDEQSFIYGRDAHIKPVLNVHKKLKDEQSTNLKKVSQD